MHSRSHPTRKAAARLPAIAACALGFLIVAAVAASGTETFTGKVVGISDGDTISVLRNNEPVKIRLDGIDCPEKGDDFGSKAKTFTASFAFGKVATVRGKESDRYGRLVARVLVDGEDLSVALVEAGLAWHYLKYSSDPVLSAAEQTAKAAKIGVWSLPNPVPPWEVRKQRREAAATDNTGPSAASGVTFHGNRTSQVFHAPWCRYYTCSSCTVDFNSRQDAIGAGYRPCGKCNP